MNPDWRELLARLADDLTARGKLSSPRWQAAFRAVPRHVFVPEYLTQGSDGHWHRVVVEGADAIADVYRDVALCTDVDATGAAVSSSSMPGLMTRMLELLDVRDGDRVLEIGTGTGYNTALLCAGLGDGQVCSIDLDYTEAARNRLAGLGYRPVVRTGDGIDGLPDHAPFDRIIATVAVDHIPGAWLGQLADGGTVLADLKLGTAAGNLVLLRKQGDGAEGRFDAGQASFMPMRHPGRPAAPSAASAPAAIEESTTAVAAIAWDQSVPWFLACLNIPARVDVGYRLGEDRRPVAARLTADDGSWAETDIDAEPRTVRQAGPMRLWDAVEKAFETWDAHGRPEWTRLGLTVTAEGQRVWLDRPDGLTFGHLPVSSTGMDRFCI